MESSTSSSNTGGAALADTSVATGAGAGSVAVAANPNNSNRATLTMTGGTIASPVNTPRLPPQPNTVDLVKQDVLAWAWDVQKRHEVRAEMLHNQHLQGLGKQLLSNRETAPAPSFGMRATQHKDNGRTSWEDVNNWAILDPGAKVPGPGHYNPERMYPSTHQVLLNPDASPRWLPDGAAEAIGAPTRREDLEPKKMVERPDTIYTQLRFRKTPCHAFNRDARFPGETRHKRIPGFRDLREQIPAVPPRLLNMNRKE